MSERAIRFRVIASIVRGAIEPGELLEAEDQKRALARLEHDEIGKYGECVLWNNGRPYLADLKAPKLPQSEKRPRISADLRAALQGAPMALNEKWVRSKNNARAI